MHRYCGLLHLHGQSKACTCSCPLTVFATHLPCPPAMYIFYLQLTMLACNLPARLLPTSWPATYLAHLQLTRPPSPDHKPSQPLTFSPATYLLVYSLAASQQPNVVWLQLSFFVCNLSVRYLANHYPFSPSPCSLVANLIRHLANHNALTPITLFACHVSTLAAFALDSSLEFQLATTTSSGSTVHSGAKPRQVGSGAVTFIHSLLCFIAALLQCYAARPSTPYAACCSMLIAVLIASPYLVCPLNMLRLSPNLKCRSC